MSLSNEWVQTLNNGGFQNRYVIVRHGQSEANVSRLVSSIFSVSVANHGLTDLGIEQACGAAQKFVDLTSQETAVEDILGSAVIKGKNNITFDPLSLDNVIFYVSDFKRAYETGHFLKETLVQSHKDAVAKAEFKKETYTPAFLEKESNDSVKTKTKTGTVARPIPFFSHPALRERFFGVFEGACPSDDIYDQIWALDKTEEPDSTHFNAESIQSVVTRTTELILELEQIWQNKIIILVSHGDITQIVQAVFASIDPRFHRSLPHMDNCDVRELLLVKGAE